MKTKKQAAEITRLLEQAYPIARCTLDTSNAWQLLVSVRLAAQCTDARVNMITPILFAKYPTINALADAPLEDITEIVKPCGLGNSKARDIKRCMTMLRDKYNGIVPDTMEELLKLPGVGRKSANLILGDIYGQPAVVADTHCIRISNRLGFMKKSDKNSKDPVHVEMRLRKVLPMEKRNDTCHRFVLHGREVCTRRSPHCENCILNPVCDYRKSLEKAAKQEK